MSIATEKTLRLIEAAAAVLEGAEHGRLNIVSLNKALFYLDLVSLLDRGAMLTGATYIALDAGPVIAKYQKRLVEALANAGIAEQTVEGASKPIQLRHPLESYRYLDNEDRQLAKQLGRFVSSRTSSMLSALSHENQGWILAHRADGPKRPINMRIAMQQLAAEDSWLDDPPDAEMQEAFDQADSAGDAW